MELQYTTCSLHISMTKIIKGKKYPNQAVNKCHVRAVKCVENQTFCVKFLN